QIAEEQEAKRREALRSPAVRRNDEPGELVFKTHENAPASAAHAESEPSYDDDELPSAFDELQSDVIAAVIAEERDRERDELERALAARDRKIAHLSESCIDLRARIATLLLLLSGPFKPDKADEKLVELKNWLRRGDAA